MPTSAHAAARSRLPLVLLAVYAAAWTALAIDPWYRQDWLLENLLVLLALPLLAVSYRQFRLSDRAYAMVFAFLLLHAVGAHYTYAEVPYDRWAQQLTGHPLGAALGFERNHYDRLVHFAYGLLVTPAFIEMLDRQSPQRGVWRWLLPLCFMLSHSAVYELVEWGAAEVFGGSLGQAYLGTQGDVWDAQKDSGLAALGAVVAVASCRWRGSAGANRRAPGLR